MRQEYGTVSTVNNYENCTFQQTDLPMEKRDRRHTVVLKESEEKQLMKLAKHFGYSHFAVFLRDMAVEGAKFSKYRNMTLSDILR